jgi:hypothetical protein
VAGRYIAALRLGRFDAVANAVARLSGPSGDEYGCLPSKLVEALGGRARRLSDDARYRDYARDYLF